MDLLGKPFKVLALKNVNNFSMSRPERRVFIRERLDGGSDIRDQICGGKFINEKLTPHPRPHYKDVLGMGKIINRMRKKSK